MECKKGRPGFGLKWSKDPCDPGYIYGLLMEGDIYAPLKKKKGVDY